MLQLTDIALFLISFAACTYCIVLSRRLKSLQDTKNGLGATILALSDSVSAITSSARETRQQASELYVRLASAIEEANQACLRLQEVSAKSDARHAAFAGEAEAAQRHFKSEFEALVADSKNRIEEMQRLNEQMRVLTSGTTETIVQAIHRAAHLQTLPKPRQVSRYEQ